MKKLDSDILEFLKSKNIFDENEELVNHLTSLGGYYNRICSECEIDYLDQGNYEATFFSGVYFEHIFDFILNLFLKHTKGHYFQNGNKRTAVMIFEHILSNYTPYKIKKNDEIEKIQLNYIQDKITKDEAIKQVKENLIIASIAKNDNVKLELLIKRGEVTEEKYISQNNTTQITLNQLMYNDLTYKRLRKPYFQRDTNSWSVERIKQLITSFKEDMLIPSVILWDSKTDGIFIVDGAHRLSALIAWVNDDYGKKIDYKKHIQVKKYIDETVGNYNELKNSDKEEHQALLNILAMKSLHIQWIIGDYNLVKASFIQINEQGVEISLDEKELIKNDKTPIAILSRDILSRVGGQKKIGSDKQLEEIHNKLFMPKYNKNNAIYSLCGDIYDDFIISRIFKLVKVIDNGTNKTYEELLKEFKEIISFITNELELNNRVYFYGVNSRYKESALSGIPKFLISLLKNRKLDKFIKNREEFERYLIENPEDIQQIIRKHRDVQKSLKTIEKYYLILLDSIEEKDFSNFEKEFAFIKEKNRSSRTKKIMEKYQLEINALKKCKICGGFINNFSSSDTHKICTKLVRKV